MYRIFVIDARWQTYILRVVCEHGGILSRGLRTIRYRTAFSRGITKHARTIPRAGRCCGSCPGG